MYGIMCNIFVKDQNVITSRVMRIFAQAKKVQISFADQRLFFFHMDSTIPLLLKSKKPASKTVQADLCRTWSETQIVGFLV